MFNDVITTYNKYVDAGVEKWQRAVLRGVFWNAIRGATFRKTGVQTVDSVQIIIPMSVKVGYYKPKAWAALADKAGYWTLQPGDTVVKGALDVEIVKSVKELQAYDDVLTITSVDTKDFGAGMSHFEVSGK